MSPDSEQSSIDEKDSENKEKDKERKRRSSQRKSDSTIEGGGNRRTREQALKERSAQQIEQASKRTRPSFKIKLD